MCQSILLRSRSTVCSARKRARGNCERTDNNVQVWPMKLPAQYAFCIAASFAGGGHEAAPSGPDSKHKLCNHIVTRPCALHVCLISSPSGSPMDLVFSFHLQTFHYWPCAGHRHSHTPMYQSDSIVNRNTSKNSQKNTTTYL